MGGTLSAAPANDNGAVLQATGLQPLDRIAYCPGTEPPGGTIGVASAVRRQDRIRSPDER